MSLEDVYDIPTVIKDLGEVQCYLSNYLGFINRANKNSSPNYGVKWREDDTCSYFTNSIVILPPQIGYIQNLKINSSNDSVDIEFNVSTVEPILQVDTLRIIS